MSLKGKCGYTDKKGNVVIPHKYDNASPFSEGLAHVELNGKHGFINKQGEEVTPIKYDDVSSFYEGEKFTTVRIKNRGLGYIDRQGNEVIPPKYQCAEPFSDGLAWVWSNGKAGAISE